MAFHYDLNAIGTNAHELPMVATALADTDDAMRYAQYDVIKKWQEMYGKGLQVILPDTFGSMQFFANAPSWVANGPGQRQDSGDPVVEVNRYLKWLKSQNITPAEKFSIPSDGLNVASMVSIESQFHGKHQTPFGFGTGHTNDFAGTLPGNTDMRPFSMVIKPYEVNGRPCVKLSNDVSKATGPKDEIERYIRIFGGQNRVERPVIV
jgi:nicotinate phosphoribosyltransferase